VALYEGKVVTDKTYGHATYGCMICCGYRGVSFNPDPVATYVDGVATVNAIGYNACGSGTSIVNGYMTTWWSDNTNIMSVTPEHIKGVSPGSANLYADAPNFPESGILDGMTCPAQDTQDTTPASVGMSVSLYLVDCSNTPTTGVIHAGWGTLNNLAGCSLPDSVPPAPVTLPKGGTCVAGTGGNNSYTYRDARGLHNITPITKRIVDNGCTRFLDEGAIVDVITP
jgi:hypothetical protein